MPDTNDLAIRIDITGRIHIGKSNIAALIALALRQHLPEMPIEIINLDGDMLHVRDRIDKAVEAGEIPASFVKCEQITIVDQCDQVRSEIKPTAHRYRVTTDAVEKTDRTPA